MLRFTVVAILLVVAHSTVANSQTCRLFALGDIHGDLDGMIKTLNAAGLVNPKGKWTGGCSTLVQTGDLVDRGAQSIACVEYIQRLTQEAEAANGQVLSLNGNHELMNFEGHYEFANPTEIQRLGGPAEYAKFFKPGHPLRKWMEARPGSVIVNTTIFVHAGIRPQYAALGLASLNRLAMERVSAGGYNVGVLGDDGPYWTRKVIFQSKAGDCGEVELSLQLLGVERMVVGHTIQESGEVGLFCDGKLVAIDLGLSSAIFSHRGMIEIRGDEVIPIYVS